MSVVLVGSYFSQPSRPRPEVSRCGEVMFRGVVGWPSVSTPACKRRGTL